jgi:hypothetical protein
MRFLQNIIEKIKELFAKKVIKMEFVKHDVSMFSIPREHRELLLKIFNNLYFEKLESFATTDSDKEKLKRITKAEQVLEIYNMFKTANINEDQKNKMEIDKASKQKKKEGHFLF